jgi:hypothetical protein
MQEARQTSQRESAWRIGSASVLGPRTRRGCPSSQEFSALITRSRSIPVAISSCDDLERISIGILQNELPFPKPVRLIGVSLSSLQANDQEEQQLDLPI